MCDFPLLLSLVDGQIPHLRTVNILHESSEPRAHRGGSTAAVAEVAATAEEAIVVNMVIVANALLALCFPQRCLLPLGRGWREASSYHGAPTWNEFSGRRLVGLSHQAEQSPAASARISSGSLGFAGAIGEVRWRGRCCPSGFGINDL